MTSSFEDLADRDSGTGKGSGLGRTALGPSVTPLPSCHIARFSAWSPVSRKYLHWHTVGTHECLLKVYLCDPSIATVPCSGPGIYAHTRLI